MRAQNHRIKKPDLRLAGVLPGVLGTLMLFSGYLITSAHWEVLRFTFSNMDLETWAYICVVDKRCGREVPECFGRFIIIDASFSHCLRINIRRSWSLERLHAVQCRG